MSATEESVKQRISTLRSLPTIRSRCTLVHNLAQKNKLEYFEYHPEKEQDVVEFCLNIMKRDYPESAGGFEKIPAHGRWRHFDTGRSRIDPLLSQWSSESPPVNPMEQTARLLDLFLVSVLLDAGAGNAWKYKEKNSGEVYGRSEGLAIASLDMFLEGVFSGSQSDKYRVDAKGLAALTPGKVGTAMQVSAENPMSGLEGRSSLLIKLSEALSQSPQYFGQEGRPGNMLKFLENKLSANSKEVHISALWEVVILGLAPIWPTDRMSLGGVALGDVWRCDALAKNSADGDDGLVPFHKLSQWLTYSLVEPIEKLLGWKITGMGDMTGLPEYRNGGLLVDMGVLTLRPGVLDASYYPNPDSKIPLIPPSHPSIIEWRAMTVIELDRIAAQINQKAGTSLSLPQILEAATWKGGREIAKQLRSQTGSGPPIEIESDGTVF
ncbi:DUF1688-domain-containing protein [Serendipita vermifera]|nr:DUF1688-domain-containing protein [Serendipita vermifera]